ncbi:killer cell lectin-like receptor subfamily F member 1 [Ambystoma mexicanum]|uniref:killer cell lectin-like receptor subfamily F member 1 n=1 Tax=Ambystoma mexicanum TaxID=8296 RepID=UPI0037E9AFA3
MELEEGYTALQFKTRNTPEDKVFRLHQEKHQMNPRFEQDCNTTSSPGSEMTMHSTGWQLFGGKCYYFSKLPKTWSESHEYCSARGSRLPVIQDKAQLDFLTSNLYKYSWIGLFNKVPGGRWTWVNGSTLNEKLFPVTGSSEGDRCGTVKNNFLESTPCRNQRWWICQKDAWSML